MRLVHGLSVLSFLVLSACGGGLIVPPATPGQRSPQVDSPPAAKPIPSTPIAALPATAAKGTNALTTGVTAGPAFDTLQISDASLTRALGAFRLSCPALLKRSDLSGLTRVEDWQSVCAAVTTATNPRRFFADNFEVVQVGTGAAFTTGYYEPEFEASRTRRPGYDIAIYARPPELVEIDLGDFSETLKGKKLRGKVSGNTFVPYANRTQIEEGILAGRGLEIAWTKDPVDLFFLQVQGSGRLRLPDGSVMQVGYDLQNGHDYTGIGKLMRDRGLLAPGQATMQGISDWIHKNPDQGRAIMRENQSWVFFREQKKIGAVGALNVIVTPGGSVAADPMFTPLGAPVFLSMDRKEPNGLWVAQDTGGAIKGANRFDTFWGAGVEATRVAGGMAARGTSFLFLPIGTVARINAEAVSGGTSPRR
jgi:membrane-bound lytic murein transglycosylase A